MIGGRALRKDRMNAVRPLNNNKFNGFLQAFGRLFPKNLIKLLLLAQRISKNP